MSPNKSAFTIVNQVPYGELTCTREPRDSPPVALITFVQAVMLER
ncbi:hypothetical protein PCS_00674 [Desulfocurvibacter africanus PCS]|uniref:Uncharacterized protein n=1 Tax=Desulfocurvibacter africanus PCS TaxID=1262666 RepID=M5PXL0_DESAF|nr:hypothetical protein PCS_00674 [Desulfocurvibacter africanus PCS]